jgi:hypothetical protein
VEHYRRIAVLIAAAMVAAPGPAPGADAFRRVGRAVQISADTLVGPPGSQDDTQVEPAIAIDPSDPSVVVAVFQQGRFSDGGSADPGFATSHDGGATWVTGNLPGLTVAVGGPFERASDPAVAFGPDGAVYATTLPFDDSDCHSGVAVQRSDDGGLSFGAPVFAQDDSSCSVMNDKNWITVDTAPGSPHRGRVYLAWDQIGSAGAPIVLRYSDDRGATWSALATVSNTNGIGVLSLVQPDGDLTLVYEEYPPSVEVSQTSHDGGVTFATPVTIGTFQDTGPPDVRTGGLPAAAVDPVTGALYAVWQDGRFRSDGLDDVVVSSSSDGGASWSAVRVVNRASTRDHFTPAVAAYGGFVHFLYRSRRNLSPRVDARYVVSADGGSTFGPERRLGRTADLRFAAVAGGRAFLGDYAGLAASADAAHAVWCLPSRPHGTPPPHQTTWSATITR